MTNTSPQHGRPTVRFLGTRGIPAAHGGFETAVEHISAYLVRNGWRVVVYCQSDGSGPIAEDTWQGVERVNVPVAMRGPAGTIAFDARALRHAAQYDDLCVTFGYNTAFLNTLLRAKRIPNIFNMDGIEWKRDKWGPAHKAFLRANERIASRLGNHLIADHPEIARHHAQSTDPAKITMIPYGSPELREADPAPLRELGLEPGGFSTVICRPEPENSVLDIVSAFCRRERGHTLAVLGAYTPGYDYHDRVLAAASDEVRFLGAIYDPAVLSALRVHSRAYLHGHRVGGTNPSLVEALGAGNPVFAHDNPYNRWVAGEGARFFDGADQLAEIFDSCLQDTGALRAMSAASRERHAAAFTWDLVAAEYERLLKAFLPAGAPAPSSATAEVPTVSSQARREPTPMIHTA